MPDDNTNSSEESIPEPHSQPRATDSAEERERIAALITRQALADDFGALIGQLLTPEQYAILAASPTRDADFGAYIGQSLTPEQYAIITARPMLADALSNVTQGAEALQRALASVADGIGLTSTHVLTAKQLAEQLERPTQKETEITESLAADYSSDIADRYPISAADPRLAHLSQPTERRIVSMWNSGHDYKAIAKATGYSNPRSVTNKISQLRRQNPALVRGRDDISDDMDDML